MNPSMHIDYFIEADTATSVHVDADGARYDARFRIRTGTSHQLTVFGDRDDVRRVLTGLLKEFDAAESALQAEELGKMDTEEDTVEIEEAVYDAQWARTAGVDTDYGRGV